MSFNISRNYDLANKGHRSKLKSKEEIIKRFAKFVGVTKNNKNF